MTTAFGNSVDTRKLEELRRQWQELDFSSLPEIEVRSATELKGANGAFAAATNQIYLSQEYSIGNVSNFEAIAAVLLEEIGHFVDASINNSDVAGDEGNILSLLVREKNK